MAERRMFAKTIIDSDAFLDMPITARLLYYDFGMRADDDGFVNSPKKIMRITGASQDDISILIAKKFIIPFDNGIVVIKHWRIHNYIRKDTYTETVYRDQKAELMLDEKGAYTTNPYDGVKLLNGETIPSQVRDDIVTGTSTQVRIGKDSLDKVSTGKVSVCEDGNTNKPNETPKKRKKEKDLVQFGEFVSMEQKEYDTLVDRYGQAFADKCVEKLDNYKGASHKKYASDYRAILTWVVEDIDKKYPTLMKREAKEIRKEVNELDMLLANRGVS